MLSIFDHSSERPASLGLLLDCLTSLARQWALRPESWHEVSPTPQPAQDGIPSFSTLDPFRPRAGAVIHGLVLSTVVFCLTCFAIRYSWNHVLHVHIPEIQFDTPRSIHSNSGSVATQTAEKTPASPLGAEATGKCCSCLDRCTGTRRPALIGSRRTFEAQTGAGARKATRFSGKHSLAPGSLQKSSDPGSTAQGAGCSRRSGCRGCEVGRRGAATRD